MAQQTYQLTITAEQAHVIQKALELFSRVHMGQLDPVAYILCSYRQIRELREEDLGLIHRFLRSVEPTATGLDPGGYWGIFSGKVQDTARVAWDLQQVVRHRLAWDREPRGGIYVDFDPPMRSSSEPLASIRRELGGT